MATIKIFKEIYKRHIFDKLSAGTYYTKTPENNYELFNIPIQEKNAGIEYGTFGRVQTGTDQTSNNSIELYGEYSRLADATVQSYSNLYTKTETETETGTEIEYNSVDKVKKSQNKYKESIEYLVIDVSKNNDIDYPLGSYVTKISFTIDSLDCGKDDVYVLGYGKEVFNEHVFEDETLLSSVLNLNDSSNSVTFTKEEDSGNFTFTNSNPKKKIRYIVIGINPNALTTTIKNYDKIVLLSGKKKLMKISNINITLKPINVRYTETETVKKNAILDFIKNYGMFPKEFSSKADKIFEETNIYGLNVLNANGNSNFTYANVATFENASLNSKPTAATRGLYSKYYLIPGDIFRYCKDDTNLNINNIFANIGNVLNELFFDKNDSKKGKPYSDQTYLNYNIHGRIPPMLFSTISNIENMHKVFSGAYFAITPYQPAYYSDPENSDTSIGGTINTGWMYPLTLFSKNVNLKNCTYVFENAILSYGTKISDTARTLFKNNKLLSDVEGLFQNILTFGGPDPSKVTNCSYSDIDSMAKKLSPTTPITTYIVDPSSIQNTEDYKNFKTATNYSKNFSPIAGLFSKDIHTKISNITNLFNSGSLEYGSFTAAQRSTSPASLYKLISFSETQQGNSYVYEMFCPIPITNIGNNATTSIKDCIVNMFYKSSLEYIDNAFNWVLLEYSKSENENLSNLFGNYTNIKSNSSTTIGTLKANDIGPCDILEKAATYTLT